MCKDGPDGEKGNYNSISVLTVVSKLLKKTVNDQLYIFLQDITLLSNWQSSFQANYFKTTPLTYLSHSLQAQGTVTLT